MRERRTKWDKRGQIMEENEREEHIRGWGWVEGRDGGGVVILGSCHFN